MNLFRFVPGYESEIYEAGKEPLFFLFLSFLIAFALVRLYTRLARSRGWGSGNVGGIHLHHIVPGIALMCVGGLLSFAPIADSPVASDLAAIIFGAGAALVLDEWALVFHLGDVYWLEQGRASVSAAIMGVMVAGLLLVSSSPFDPGSSRTDDSKTAFFATIAANLVFATVSFLKAKPFLGITALFFSPVGWVAAVRLAKPSSPWAHWFYDPARGRSPDRRARKLARSRKRFSHSRLERFQRWFTDLIGGKPLEHADD
jgi:lysyl-tRNA synthetase class 2